MARISGNGSVVALEKPEKTCMKWQLRVSLGKDYATGKYITKTRRVIGSKTEAQTELRAFINELESGIRVDTQHLTFAEFADVWQEERRLSGEIEKGTLRKDEYHIRSLNLHIGSVRLVDINADTVATLYLNLRHGGSISGEPMSGTSVHHIAVTLKHILAQAVQRDILIKNPCDKVKTPRVDTPEKTALTKAEARRLISILMEGEPTAHRTGALLALMCGLRREEVLGLRWLDFDKTQKCIHIRYALPSDGGELKVPKTKAGRRTLPLDSDTFARLERWQHVQARILHEKALREANAKKASRKTGRKTPSTKSASRTTKPDARFLQTPETPIVASRNGGFIHPQNFSRWWQTFRKTYGFEGISLHQLRHTYATLLVANGVDIVTSKTLMGHADTKMLTDLYAHCVSENVTRASSIIGGILHEETRIVEVEGLVGVK